MAEEIVQVGTATETGQESTAIVPLIGLVVSLDNPREVAVALKAVREAKSQLDAARASLERLLVEESERQGVKTLHLDGVTATVSGGQRPVWDIETLEQLREIGLPEERFDKLVTTVITHKVNAAVAGQIAGANPEYERIINAARSYEPTATRVSVE